MGNSPLCPPFFKYLSLSVLLFPVALSASDDPPPPGDAPPPTVRRSLVGSSPDPQLQLVADNRQRSSSSSGRSSREASPGIQPPRLQLPGPMMQRPLSASVGRQLATEALRVLAASLRDHGVVDASYVWDNLLRKLSSEKDYQTFTLWPALVGIALLYEIDNSANGTGVWIHLKKEPKKNPPSYFEWTITAFLGELSIKVLNEEQERCARGVLSAQEFSKTRTNWELVILASEFEKLKLMLSPVHKSKGESPDLQPVLRSPDVTSHSSHSFERPSGSRPSSGSNSVSKSVELVLEMIAAKLRALDCARSAYEEGQNPTPTDFGTQESVDTGGSLQKNPNDTGGSLASEPVDTGGSLQKKPSDTGGSLAPDTGGSLAETGGSLKADTGGSLQKKPSDTGGSL